MKIDLRKKIAEGEERDRQISLKLEKKYRPISDAIWKEKQDETYMNTLRIKPDLSLANVLANEMENINHFDPIIVNQVSTSLLLQITGQKIAEYILDRLTTGEKNRMNQYWPEILRDLKKRNLRLNKEFKNTDFGHADLRFVCKLLDGINNPGFVSALRLFDDRNARAPLGHWLAD